MSTKPFVIGSNQPLIKGCVVTYVVSGQPLEAIETVQAVVRLPYASMFQVLDMLLIFQTPGSLLACYRKRCGLNELKAQQSQLPIV